MKIRIVDFETNGVEPTDALVQVGKCDIDLVDGVDLTDGMKRHRPFDDCVSIGAPSAMFVNAGHALKPEARAVHHISPRDIEGAPSVDIGIKSLIDGEPDVYCAHRAAFEQQYFNPAGSKWICTLKVGRRLWPESPSHSNQCLRYYLNVDDDYDFDAKLAMPPHRAAPDCYTTAHILKRALKSVSVDDMIKWTSEPSLLPGKLGFGKHRDVLWSQCDAGYLEWMTRQTDMDLDKLFTAKHWLDRRRSDNQ